MISAQTKSCKPTAQSELDVMMQYTSVCAMPLPSLHIVQSFARQSGGVVSSAFLGMQADGGGWGGGQGCLIARGVDW